MKPGEKKESAFAKERSQTRNGHEETTFFGYQEVPAGEKLRLVRHHFNTVAGRYDLMNSVLSFGLHHLWKRTAVRMLGLSAGEWVIDVCGGTGDLSFLAAKAVGPRGRVVLYDINRPMMEAGRPKAIGSLLAERILWVQGDAEEISFDDGIFDAAMVGFGIRNLTHMEKGFKEMYRLLKPGGRLMCLEFSRPTAPWFRFLYDLYSFTLMPLAGMIVVGSRRAYTYLPESIRMFPSPERLASMLEERGLSQVTYRKLTNGIAVIHLGVKR